MKCLGTGCLFLWTLVTMACSPPELSAPVFHTRSPGAPGIGFQHSDTFSPYEDWAVASDSSPGPLARSDAALPSSAPTVRTFCGDGTQGRGEYCFQGHTPPIKIDNLNDIRSLSLGDWDGDGLPDLLVTRVSTRTYQVLGSTPEAPFSRVLLEEEMPGDTKPYTATFLDLNEDDRLDIVVSGTGYELITRKGDGEGNAYDFWIPPFVMSYYYARWRWMEMRDANGDGLLDLVGFRDVYENAKWGQALVSLQNEMNSFNYPRVVGEGRDTIFVDLDHDGDLDAVMEHKQGEFLQLIYQDSSIPMEPVYEVVEGPPGSSGGAVPWKIEPLQPLEFLVGALDEMRLVRFDPINQLFDLSTFATDDELNIKPWHPLQLDVDNDGGMEILWSLTSGSRFGLMSPDSENPLQEMVLGDAGPTRDRVTLGDADGDGLPEALFYSAREEGLRIVNIDPEGLEEDSVAVLRSNLSADQIMSGDFNGDGFDDLAGVRRDSRPVILLSDGKGGIISEHELAVDGLGGTGVATGDLDGDGRDELLVVGTQRLVIGGLTEDGEPWHQSQFLSHGVYSVAVAESPDVNGDGHADLFISANTKEIHMYVGQGDLSFEHLWTGTHDGDEASLRVGDFNGDGYAGVVAFGRYPKTLTRAFHNTGGVLANSPFTLSVTKRHVEVGDVNGDGRDDIVGGGGGGNAQVAFSTPGNSFVVVERDGDPKDEQSGLAVADLDGYRGDEIIVPDGGDLVVLKAECDVQYLQASEPVEVARWSKRGVQRRLVSADVNGDGFVDLWSVRSGILVNSFINRP